MKGLAIKNTEEVLPFSKMSLRLRKAMEREKILTYGELSELEISDIARMKGCGKKCVKEFVCLFGVDAAEWYGGAGDVKKVELTQKEMSILSVYVYKTTKNPGKYMHLLEMLIDGVRVNEIAIELGGMSRSRVREMVSTLYSKIRDVQSGYGVILAELPKRTVRFLKKEGLVPYPEPIPKNYNVSKLKREVRKKINSRDIDYKIGRKAYADLCEWAGIHPYDVEKCPLCGSVTRRRLR